jgi:hypothetical protein
LVHDFDELLGSGYPRVVTSCALINHVFANVIFDHFGDKTIESASASGSLLQYTGAFLISLDRSFDRLDLTTQSLEPI